MSVTIKVRKMLWPSGESLEASLASSFVAHWVDEEGVPRTMEFVTPEHVGNDVAAMQLRHNLHGSEYEFSDTRGGSYVWRTSSIPMHVTYVPLSTDERDLFDRAYRKKLAEQTAS